MRRFRILEHGNCDDDPYWSEPTMLGISEFIAYYKKTYGKDVAVFGVEKKSE